MDDPTTTLHVLVVGCDALVAAERPDSDVALLMVARCTDAPHTDGLLRPLLDRARAYLANSGAKHVLYTGKTLDVRRFTITEEDGFTGWRQRRAPNPGVVDHLSYGFPLDWAVKLVMRRWAEQMARGQPATLTARYCATPPRAPTHKARPGAPCVRAEEVA